MDCCLERSRDRCTRIGEEIDTQVNSAALMGGIRTPSEEGRSVNEPGLIVAADGDGYIGRPHERLNLRRHALLTGMGGISAEECTAYAEIEDNAIPFPEIHRDQCRGVGISRKPLMNSFGTRNRRETTGCAK